MHKIKHLVAKFLTGIILLLTILLGINAASLGLFETSIFFRIGIQEVTLLKIVHLVTGIATMIASVLLFIKVYLKK